MTKPICMGAVVVGLLASHALGRPRSPAVVLLDNQQTLVGEVERTGEQYRVRREGGETVIPAARVLTVSPDLNAAYEFLRSNVAAGDADGHLRLARWCDAKGVRAQAARGGKEGARPRPNPGG